MRNTEAGTARDHPAPDWTRPVAVAFDGAAVLLLACLLVTHFLLGKPVSLGLLFAAILCLWAAYLFKNLDSFLYRLRSVLAWTRRRHRYVWLRLWVRPRPGPEALLLRFTAIMYIAAIVVILAWIAFLLGNGAASLLK
jgi:hypothetical protein